MFILPDGDPLKFGLVVRFSPEELKFLSAVMVNIGGNPETSRRKHADTISDTLYRAGVPRQFRELAPDLSGTIRFGEKE